MKPYYVEVKMMTEKDDDIQTQHEWRHKHVDAWRAGMGLTLGLPIIPLFYGQPKSNRQRVREKEKEDLFLEFWSGPTKCYGEYFRISKVQ